MSDPACTLNKNIPNVSDPVHQHLINDGLWWSFDSLFIKKI
jgi:hypothetical protein